PRRLKRRAALAAPCQYRAREGGQAMAGDGRDPQGDRSPPARARPGGPPAQGALPWQTAAARRARHRRALLLACAVMSSLVLLFAGSAWALATYANGTVGRIFAGTAERLARA